MDQATKTRLRSTLAAIIAAVAFLAPDIAKWIGAVENASGWVSTAIRFVGFAVAICTDGRGVALLNILLPDGSNSKPERPKDFPGTVAGLVFAGALLLSGSAHADSQAQLGACSGAYCVTPATSLGWTANLKTGDVTSAAVMVGAALVRNGAIPLGAGIYGGTVVSASGAHPQLAALFSVANFAAVGPGLMMFKDSTGAIVKQVTLNLSLNLNFGGTPQYVAEVSRPRISLGDF